MKKLTSYYQLPEWKRQLMTLAVLLAMGFLSCGGPSQSEIILSDSFGQTSDANDLELSTHKVEIVQVLKTDSYLYMEVTEAGRKFWIATGPGNVRPGSTYYFNEAVRKYNFESKALVRVFDSIYLVPRLVPESKLASLDQRLFDPHKPGQKTISADTLPLPDDQNIRAITIPELLRNPEAFENSWVELSGTCVKVNSGIMGRNWVHLKAPGEAGGEVVVTTREEVVVGELVQFQAVVRRNRDFGAGYLYELLLEEGFRID